MTDTTIWIVVLLWAGGKIEPVKAFTDERAARHAASLLIGNVANVALWSVELQQGIE
jgi:hypothetical protein